MLFSDVRGFTSLSERMPPETLTELLNSMLTPLTQALLTHDATIDKYIGDAIMAFWNAPLAVENHPRRACQAALAMMREMTRLNRESGRTLEIGLGLNRGTACVGNLGSHQRFSYSAIGDTVNLASRVEGMTKQYGVPILLTEAARVDVQDFATLEVDRVRVVGRDEAVALYALLGDARFAQNETFCRHREAHEQFLAAWRAGDFTRAATLLEPLAAHAPRGLECGAGIGLDFNLAPLYAVYSQRLAIYQANPPENWDGIHQATAK